MDFEEHNSPVPSDPELAGDVSSTPIPSPGRDRATASTIVPVVLSGGCGSRLWPYSTEGTPKQFLAFVGAKSLFQLTLERVLDRNRFSDLIVVGSLSHADLCARDVAAARASARLILEPCARNTAAAIAMAAAVVANSHGEDALLLVMPSDHAVEDVAAFHEAVSVGTAAARDGYLVTFGIEPSTAETGFGYIEAGEALAGAKGVRRVQRFVEKPDLHTAQQMLSDSKHLWNAGIFLFRAGTLLEEMELHAPAIASAAMRAVENGESHPDRILPDIQSLADCPNESIDYAVMEHSERVAVVPMSVGWSDLGSWDALVEILDARNNGPITALDCDDCFIRSDGLQVAALGVRDLIIVASGQRLLILPRGRSQELKKLLSAMESIAA